MSNIVVSKPRDIVADTRDTVRSQLLAAKELIAPTLPKHVSFDRCVAQMYKHLYADPKLGECTTGSLFWAFVQAAEVGLSVGTFFGEGFIIPYGSSRNPAARKRAKFIPGYKGLLKLAYQSPLVLRVDAYTIYEKDKFVADLGQGVVEYVPYLGAENPGAFVAAYVQIELAQGAIKHHVSPLWALERIRKSAPGGGKPDHPWNTHRGEMYRKTALRAALKDAPKSTDVDKALEKALAYDEQSDMPDVYDQAEPELPGLPADDEQPTRTQASKSRVASRAKQAPKAPSDEAPPDPQTKAPPTVQQAPSQTAKPKSPPTPAISQPEAPAPQRQAPVQAQPDTPETPAQASPAAPAATAEPDPEAQADDEQFDAPGASDDDIFG